MRKYLKFINYILINFGINLRKFPKGFKGLYLYLKDLKDFNRENNNSLFPINTFYPIFGNRYGDAGTMSGHYFHQDYYVAKKIFENNPKEHLDVGSRIDGFVAHVAIFRKILLIDVRPSKSTIENIEFIQADLTQENNEKTNLVDSLSCLHAIEHFGLGRYGDPIDSEGHIKGLNRIYNMLKKDGIFYFSTPIGPQRIEFNAHRVFSIGYLIELFSDKYEILKFSYVDDLGVFHEGVTLTEANINANFNCKYGCGIFEMKKN